MSARRGLLLLPLVVVVGIAGCASGEGSLFVTVQAKPGQVLRAVSHLNVVAAVGSATARPTNVTLSGGPIDIDSSTRRTVELRFARDRSGPATIAVVAFDASDRALGSGTGAGFLTPGEESPVLVLLEGQAILVDGGVVDLAAPDLALVDASASPPDLTDLGVGPDLVQPPDLSRDPNSDDFNSSALGTQWSWVREDSANWSLTTTPGLMRITTQVGDLFGTFNDAHNVLLQNGPAGDVTISTRVTINASQDYQQAGVIMYVDDDNYLKLTVASVSGNLVYHLSREITGTFITLVMPPDSNPGQAIVLKLSRTGTLFTGYFSIDNGMTFAVVGSVNITGFGMARLGVVAQNGRPSTASSIAADFDYFYRWNY